MVFVTGGTGLLGSHLIYHLLQKGEDVRALKRKSGNFELISKVFSFYTPEYKTQLSKIEWYEGNLCDVYSMDLALKDIDKIYHSAALVSFHPSKQDEMMNTNIKGTEVLVNVAIDNRIKKFCHVSSIAALGRADKGKELTENIQWKSSGQNSNYAVSKYGAEREVWRGIEEGLNAVIVNPSIILGPGDMNNGSGKLISMIWNGLKFYTRGVNGFVDVRDVVKAMILLTESDIFSERFIVSAENLSYEELFRIIAGHLNVASPKFYAPDWIGKLVWRLESAKSKLLKSKPVITRETARTARNKYFYSSTKLIDTLGFEYMSMVDSLKDSCNMFLQNQK